MDFEVFILELNVGTALQREDLVGLLAASQNNFLHDLYPFISFLRILTSEVDQFLRSVDLEMLIVLVVC